MRTHKITMIVVVFFLPVLMQGQAPNDFQTYRNARFNYSISYPANILVPQGEADNGDGQKFVSRDGRTEMIVYGANNSLDKTLRQLYDAESSSTAGGGNRRVTYRLLKRGWFAVSGIEGGRIFYQKTLLTNGVIKTFRIEYNEEAKATFNPITTKIARSFKG
jgi:hypothetical protein